MYEIEKEAKMNVCIIYLNLNLLALPWKIAWHFAWKVNKQKLNNIKWTETVQSHWQNSTSVQLIVRIETLPPPHTFTFSFHCIEREREREKNCKLKHSHTDTHTHKRARQCSIPPEKYVLLTLKLCLLFFFLSSLLPYWDERLQVCFATLWVSWICNAKKNSIVSKQQWCKWYRHYRKKYQKKQQTEISTENVIA